MAIPARTSRPGSFFITSRTQTSRRLFQVPAHCDLFLATLQHYRAEGHYLLHAFVVMPDHIHLLLTPTASLERTMSLIKGGFSHRLASTLPVWQRSYTDHRIRDKPDFLAHRDYIHANPVRANLSPTPEAYPYSSAKIFGIPTPTNLLNLNQRIRKAASHPGCGFFVSAALVVCFWPRTLRSALQTKRRKVQTQVQT